MRLSMVFELLLIFLLVAFAAYARVIDRDEATTLHRVLRAATVNAQKQGSNIGVSTISLKQATDNVNKYCTCNDNICNCCRDFNIPVVQLKGPGCASVQYLKGDNMALQLSFGENILTSTVVNGKSPKPVCVPLPGGFSKFCGRIYSIQREVGDHFKACLGLELESSRQVEASLRVSCFRFGPDGLKLRPAEPLPVIEADESSNDDDDDDDDVDDYLGLGSDDDEDDDDDEDEDDDADDTPTGNAVPSSSADDEEEDDDDDEDDVLGLSSIFDIFGDDDTPSKKPKVTTPAPAPPISIPLLTRPIVSDSPIVVEVGEPAISANDVSIESTADKPVEGESTAANGAEENVTEKVVDTTSGSSVIDKETTIATVEDLVPLGSVIQENVIQPAASSAQEEYVLKPSKDVNKINPQPTKKPTITSSSLNAIENDVKKPVAGKPGAGKPDPVKNEVAVESSEEDGEEEDEEEEDDDEDILDDDDDDKEELEDDDEGEKDEGEDEEEDDEEEEENDVKKPGSAASEEEDDEEDESVVDDEDEDDSDEALITALSGNEKDEGKVDKISTNEAEDLESDDADYGIGLADMLARKRNRQRHITRPRGRQSKVMRL